MWPHVAAAARYLETLRQTERTDANPRPETRAFYGLLPPSISHEGYSAKPMHSYWDDFWALKGYAGRHRDGAAAGRAEAARRLEAQRDEFRADLAASLRACRAPLTGSRILPGAAELGDFDPTSTTIAHRPAGELHRLPLRPGRSPPSSGTGASSSSGATDAARGRTTRPTRSRTIGTFVRLGWRDRAHQLLEFFLADRRPPAWNQWPEVIGRDARQPRFVGDLPHGWVASDFIRATLDLFAYERDGDHALVLAAGVPPAWLREGGVTVKALRTPYGPLSYSLRRVGGTVVLNVSGGSRVPPGGFVLAWPGPERRRAGARQRSSGPVAGQ